VLKLLVVRGEAIEAEHELTRRNLRIGRSAQNDIVLSDPTNAVSRHHAELRYERGGYVLVDLNSQNGTWVDGHSIRRVDFGPGASALIGPYCLMVEDAAKADREVPGKAAPLAGADARPGSAEPGRVARAPRIRPRASAATPQGGGPIAWLARQPKPLVFGGFVVFMVLLLTVLHLLSPSPEKPAAPHSTAKSNEETVAGLLSEGQALLDKGDAVGALGYLERALIIKPDDPRALELKLKAQELRREPPSTKHPEASR